MMWIIFAILGCGPKESSPDNAMILLSPLPQKRVLASTALNFEYASVESMLLFETTEYTFTRFAELNEPQWGHSVGYAYILEGSVAPSSEHATGELMGADVKNPLSIAEIAPKWQMIGEYPAKMLVVDVHHSPSEGGELPVESALQVIAELDGPKEHSGIEAVHLLKELDLAEKFPELSGKVLRTRLFELAGESAIAQHIHQERSGFVYVLSGEIMEYRNDHEDGILHSQGDVISEINGLEHYWLNESGQPVQLLSVDIFTKL